MFNVSDLSIRRFLGLNRKRRTFKPKRPISLEQLESRAMLAANVVVSGNNVTVTGGADADNLVIEIVNTVRVRDIGTGIIQNTGLTTIGTLTINTLAGNDQVRVNLPQVPQSNSIGTLNINTADGNDTVTLTAGNVTSSMTVNTSSGDDRVTSSVFSALQNVTINTDTGVDTVLYGGVVGQNLTINTGAGRGRVRLNGPAGEGGTTQLAVGNNVSITGGTDVDFVSMAEGQETRVGGNMTINTQAGNDRVALNPAAPLRNTRIGGDFTVTTADGNDRIETRAALVQGNVRQDSGSGNDLNFVENSAIAGTLNVLDSAGTNTLRLTDVRVLGNTTVSGGSNTDNITIGATVPGGSQFSADLIVRGNAGDDTVRFDTLVDADPGAPVVLQPGVLMLAGYSRLTLDGGAGTDRLTPVFGVSNAVRLEALGADVLAFELFV